MTEAFIARLKQAQAEYEGVLGGLVGGILGIIIEFNNLARDERAREWEEHRKLKSRIKDLEDQVNPSTGDGVNGGVVPPLPVPPGPGTAHDYNALATDLGSSAVSGAFAINTTLFAKNAQNTTGTGLGSTLQFFNISTSDKQLVGGHRVVLRAAGTPGTPAVNAPIYLWSANFPTTFDRTPAVRAIPIDANAASLTTYLDVTPTGYTLYVVGGTLTANQNYTFQIAVNPS